MKITQRLIEWVAVAVMALGAAPSQAASGAMDFSLTPIGRYTNDAPFELSAAEIVTHDPIWQRLYVGNARDIRVDILDIHDPAHPTKIGHLDMSPYGKVVNSVDVKNGLVAVAVEAAVKTDPGVVVFFDSGQQHLRTVVVGSLPDMVTFSPDGRWLLCANEGEPNTYNNFGSETNGPSVDPEGSISIIDLSGGAAAATVRTADFRAFTRANIPAGVRIYGPGASVAQDLEPEYIAVSDDSSTAWVTLQENNALAVVDILNARVTKIAALGYKDHSQPGAGLDPSDQDPTTDIYEFDPAAMPPIGTTAAGQQLSLGGFSGLHFEGIDPATGRYKFVTHTDRGPNAEPTGILRPFLLPDFTPQIVRFEFDPVAKSLSLTQRIPLQRAPGDLLTGLANIVVSTNANDPYNDEVPVDLLGNVLQLDPLGADVEGIAVDPVDGSFWMVDEYRPSIYHFDSAGVLIKRYVPTGTAAAAGQPAGTFGDEVLPAVLAQRRQNRGFEGIALSGGKIYAFVQSPLRNPVSLGNSALNAMQNIRVVEFDPATLATKQFIYIMDNPNSGAAPNSRADKIGDAVSFGNGEFLVLERDDDALPEDTFASIEKKIYRFNLTGATDVSAYTGTVGTTGKTVDQMTRAELATNNIRAIEKTLFVDLNVAGYNRAQKAEGLTVIDSTTVAVINDNDFGVANIIVNPDGTFTVNYVPEKEQLGIVYLRRPNIRPWPIKGIYCPDSIAAYKFMSKSYLVLANEGDTREWPGFREDVRLSTRNLDTNVFPTSVDLKRNHNLGRLNVSSVDGDIDGDGDLDEIYSYGGRSFSIRDAMGNLIFDSGDHLEQLTAAIFPRNFNASHSNNTFDNRSPSKGPEPEGVAVGKVAGRTLAFIGLERIGGVAVYDVTNPFDVHLVDYVNTRSFAGSFNFATSGDLGPEGLHFISADDSPNGKPLLVMAHEISGSTVIFQINKTAAKREL